VRFPPGRARLATKPDPIGSETFTNTIGIELVCRWSAAVTAVVCAALSFVVLRPVVMAEMPALDKALSQKGIRLLHCKTDVEQISNATTIAKLREKAKA